jgi:uncharacterized membrane protein
VFFWSFLGFFVGSLLIFGLILFLMVFFGGFLYFFGRLYEKMRLKKILKKLHFGRYH